MSCSEPIFEYPNLQDDQNAYEFNDSIKKKPTEFCFYDKKYKVQEGVSIWESQLNKTIEKDSIMMRDGLKLNHYEYIREIVSIEDLESVKTQLIEDNTLFICYDASNKHFTISENEELATNYQLFINMLLPTSVDILQTRKIENEKKALSDIAYIFEKNDLCLVKLEWEYKGRLLHTQCVVSKKKGVIYDKFLFFIHSLTTNSEVKENVKRTENLYLKSGNLDSIRQSLNGPILYEWINEDAWYNVYGNVLYEYSIKVRVFGQLIDGVKHILDKSINHHSDALWPLYSCSTVAATKDYSTGADGHLTFMWAVAYGTGVGVSIGWNGTGFEFSGGGHGEGGEELVLPCDLTRERYLAYEATPFYLR
ncbi:hypothetical protein JXM83_06810 [Candidatus Woesearchaeota archaeon]|nr:hypothetical protein [Candidatus Woesearchaeota archaeon]